VNDPSQVGIGQEEPPIETACEPRRVWSGQPVGWPQATSRVIDIPREQSAEVLNPCNHNRLPNERGLASFPCA
jgi:hypothetical protein